MYCKICIKANGLGKEFQGRNIQNTTLGDMLVFKNTKRPTCVYMIKNITPTLVIYF